MTLDYTAFGADIATVIADLGQVGTVTRQTITGGGPTSTTSGTASSTSYAATFVVIPIGDRNVGMGVGDTNLRETDVEIYAAVPVSITPDPNDIFVTAQGSYIVLGSKQIAPSGVTVVHQCWGRNYGNV